MRIYLINGKRHGIVVIALKSFLILTVTLSISLGVVLRGMGKELFIETAGENVESIVIIDAGHGGEDPGAVSEGGVYEKDLNLAIAMAVGKELDAQGVTVVYTRTEDRLLYREEENIKGMRKLYDLKNRCAVGAEYPTALFVSIHMNSFADSKYSGLQVYYADAGDDSRRLATSIQTSVIEMLQPDNTRSVKNGKGMYLLDKTVNTAVLIECGFLTNSEECKKLSEKEYQKQLSFSIVCGIIKYMEEKNALE